jgi:hypothetical protein
MGDRKSWIFTFGANHKHPATGESLLGCFIEVPGNAKTSRERMFESFGPNWAFQYRNREDAGVDRFSLKQLLWYTPAQAYRAVELVDWLTHLDEPEGRNDRQTVTLNQIIERARAVRESD